MTHRVGGWGGYCSWALGGGAGELLQEVLGLKSYCRTHRLGGWGGYCRTYWVGSYCRTHWMKLEATAGHTGCDWGATAGRTGWVGSYCREGLGGVVPSVADVRPECWAYSASSGAEQYRSRNDRPHHSLHGSNVPGSLERSGHTHKPSKWPRCRTSSSSPFPVFHSHSRASVCVCGGATFILLLTFAFLWFVS